MAIQLWRSKNGVNINSQNYDFEHVDRVSVDDPVRKHLTRGANSKSKTGLPYLENSKQAKTINMEVLDLSKEMRDMLNNCYENEDRIGVYCVDTATGESYNGNNCLVTGLVWQPVVSSEEETYNVTLSFETYDLELA
uniref:Tail tube protein n=1 Tax=Dulem virus 29 TaxID=3145747 RepID=A0AAU8AUZ1_9CAUD